MNRKLKQEGQRTGKVPNTVQDDQHIFISYQGDYKETVLKVRDYLQSKGYKTWVDEDDMIGSVFDSMAVALQKASAVLICLSDKYKQSSNCQKETEYAMRLQKPIIPLRLQEKYVPNDWLGAVIGCQLVLDVSIPEKFDKSMIKMIQILEKLEISGSKQLNISSDDDDVDDSDEDSDKEKYCQEARAYTGNVQSRQRNDQHVFISYQRDSMATILKIRNHLQSNGYKTWVDQDDMFGSIMESMTNALENAFAVLVCISKKYKESLNCRSEGEYAFRLKKPIIALRLEENYVADGWLGMLVGSKYVHDVSKPYMFEKSMKSLIKTLEDLKGPLVSQTENESLNWDIDTFTNMLQTKNKALDGSKFSLEIKFVMDLNGRSFDSKIFSPEKVIEAANILAVSDANKPKLVQAGVLNYYFDILKMKYDVNDKVVSMAAEGLWMLSFKCRKEIMNFEGYMEVLVSAKKHQCQSVKENVKGIIWELKQEEHNTAKIEKVKAIPQNDQHIFISYQRDSMATILKVRDHLNNRGYKTWIDEDDMSGSVLESMGIAVDKASVVVVCISEKYKNSTSCRSEGEYAFRCQKTIIPLRLQEKYVPNGWLGVLIGSKQVHDVSKPEKFDNSMKKLMKTLKDLEV